MNGYVERPVRTQETTDKTGNMACTYTVRLELADDPAELLQALDAVAADGGTVRSVSYDRGDVTPRGNVAADLVMEVEPDHVESILGAWRESGIEVVDTRRERDTDSVTVLLDGAPTETALAMTLEVITEERHVSISELSWAAADDASDRPCTRIRAVVDQSVDGDPLREIRRLATERGCQLIE